MLNEYLVHGVNPYGDGAYARVHRLVITTPFVKVCNDCTTAYEQFRYVFRSGYNLYVCRDFANQLFETLACAGKVDAHKSKLPETKNQMGDVPLL